MNRRRRRSHLLLGHALDTIVHDGEFDTVALRQTDPRLVGLSDDHHVLETSREVVVLFVLQVDDLEGSRVLLTVGDDTDTTDTVSTSDHAHVAVLELAVIEDLSGGDLDADGVVGLDSRIREADGAGVVGDDVVDTLGALDDVLDTAQLVGGLLLGDLVDDEATLSIVQQAEVLLGLLQRDNIHETGRVGVIGADLSVDLDQALDEDHLSLTVVQGVLQAVTEEDDQRQALTLLVGTRGRLRGPHTGKLIEHPVAGRSHALHMSLRTTSHLVEIFLLLRTRKI